MLVVRVVRVRRFEEVRFDIVSFVLPWSFVMRKLLLLCSLFILSSLEAMDQLQLKPLIKQMTEENRSVSPDDFIVERLARNTAICMAHPLDFFDPRTKCEELLLNHVMQEPLMLDGRDISEHEDGDQLKKDYKKSQEKKIKKYYDRLSKDTGGAMYGGICLAGTSPVAAELAKITPCPLLSISCYLISCLCICGTCCST